jgi:DNA polymerase-4
MLTAVLGNTGFRLLKLAQGVDPTPVVPFQRAPQLSLAHSFDRDEIDWNRLEAFLFQQVEEAAWVLRRHNRFPGQVVVKILYADGITIQGRVRLPPGIHHLDRQLFEIIRQTFKRLFQRRVALRRMVLNFSHFSMPFRQMSLFQWEEQKRVKETKIQKALDSIRQRFGRQAISWGQVVEFPVLGEDAQRVSSQDSQKFEWTFR